MSRGELFRREVERRMRTVIARELVVPVARVTDQASFRDQLGADSLDMVTLTRAIEEEFKVPVTDDEAEFCQTVGTAIELLWFKLERGGAHDRRRP